MGAEVFLFPCPYLNGEVELTERRECTSRTGILISFPNTGAGSPRPLLLWARMLAYPGGAATTSIEILPVAVDVQVRKVTEYLGVARTRGQALEKIRRYAPVTRASVVDRR